MPDMNAIAYPLTIYYDAACPVCRDEIALLKRYDPTQKLATVDCSPTSYTPPGDAPPGVTRDAMMTLIHAQDAKGQWLVGAPVFAAAYAGCGFAEFAWLWGHPHLQGVWRIIYPFIARNRMAISRLGAGHALEWMMGKMHARAVKRALAASSVCAVNDSKNCS